MTDSPESSRYPHLLSPLKAGRVTLRNRMIMGSMHTRLDMEENGLHKMAVFLAERAKGEVGLIITGGYAPNTAGLIEPGGPILAEYAQAQELRRVTDAVHRHGGMICLQILHSGRYARQQECLGPSDIRSRINRFAPRAMSGEQIEQTISDYVRCAMLAKEAGFDGVEIMGSEGYLINEFTVLRTNDRTDEWGGSEENRINTPDVAEAILAAGDSDLVSMARPMLADPYFAKKVREGRADKINICIACNQACLDLIFSDRSASCLVNPRACRETEFDEGPAARTRKVAVIGAGAGGLAAAAEASRRGHKVTLFEATDRVGGQINLARAVPGKAEFDEMLRYYSGRIADGGVELRLNASPSMGDLKGHAFDAVVVASGVHPRVPDIAGIDHRKVVLYSDLLSGKRHAGRKVAIIGAGGIGFDVAEYLCHSQPGEAPNARGMDVSEFQKEWNVDASLAQAGGLNGDPLAPRQSPREITMLQRKASRPGINLGVSTGWILRSSLAKRNVRIMAGVTYQRIDDGGLHIVVDGAPQVIEADTIVICAGQESNRGLFDELHAAGIEAHLIGGAKEAAELDAMRAVDEGVRIAQAL